MQLQIKEKQTDRLLNYLLTGKTIDPLESWKRLGIYRLAARIYDLRQQGYDIEKNQKTILNSFGEECRIASYKIAHNN